VPPSYKPSAFDDLCLFEPKSTALVFNYTYDESAGSGVDIYIAGMSLSSSCTVGADDDVGRHW
jgi:hypothetical protein